MLQFREWNPSGNQFGFSLGEDQEIYIGSLNFPALKVEPPIFGIIDMRWVNEEIFIYMQGKGEKYDLVLAAVNGASIIIDSIVNSRIEFDYFWKK
jgi:hypothetical protein